MNNEIKFMSVITILKKVKKNLLASWLLNKVNI